MPDKSTRAMPPEYYRHMLGTKVGRLTIRIIGWWDPDALRRPVYCTCDCGGSIVVHLDSLQRNNTRSCGCIKREHITKARKQYLEQKEHLYAE